MWTRGKDKEQPGTFVYELWDGNRLVERVGGFDTAQEADRAAELAQRAMLFPSPALTDDDMADIEAMLAELTA